MLFLTFFQPFDRINRFAAPSNFEIKAALTRKTCIPDLSYHLILAHLVSDRHKKLLGVCIKRIIILAMIQYDQQSITFQPVSVYDGPVIDGANVVPLAGTNLDSFTVD